MDYARGVLEVEMNSATDNPLVFKREVLSGGNFHGEPVAFALDFLGLAVHQIGNFSERRTARLVDGKLSCLPPFLIEGQGLESGMMIPQYVAASLVNESKLLASPASADSIPSSANQEDFNSMGAASADKLERILANSEYVVAIELMCAAQALEFQRLSPGLGPRTALAFLREGVPRLTHDREMSSDIEWIRDRIMDGSLVEAVESAILIS
jgi:histidine ammonia-lyase